MSKKQNYRKIYRESPTKGNIYRDKLYRQLQDLIRKKQKEADSHRQHFFQPDLSSLKTYLSSVECYREKLKELLGWPLTLKTEGKTHLLWRKKVTVDACGQIERIWIETGLGTGIYGLFFQPFSASRWPLVISQHGGGGTPELTAGFFGSANYNEMTRRVWKKGIAVWAPQLFLWGKDFGVQCDHLSLDRKWKHLGGSLAALEIYRLQKSLDVLLQFPEIDRKRVGMIGLSYGGFYTLLLAALDTRIKVAVSSCWFNNRFLYDFGDASWFDSAKFFLDAEIACLVCPRPLYIEVGRKDPLFLVQHARSEQKKVAAVYKKLQRPENFVYREFAGGHELDIEEKNIDFLLKHLQG